MKLSVIIPVFNNETFLNRCLNSVLNQRTDNFEIEVIIINDGSTDKSGEIADYYSSQNNNIYVIHQKNQGVSVARNEGLRIASGDYIHFLDSDDFLLHKNCYQALIDIINNADNPIDILRFRMVRLFANRIINIDQYNNLDKINIEFEGTGIEACHQLRFVGQIGPHIYSYNLIKKIDLKFCPEVRLSEDALFNLVLYRHANYLIINNANIYCYYAHEGSATFTNDKKRIKVLLDSMLESLPIVKAHLNLYDDSFFKSYRMEVFGEDVAKRMLKAGLSYSSINKYIKNGYKSGIFPVGKIHNGHTYRFYDMLLNHPLLFWLFSFPYRYIILPCIKPLMLKNG